METFAQELIDAIIDYIPPLDTRSCSLVARGWRQRSQQHYFSNLRFAREQDVVLWYTNIPQDPDGIPSYAHNVEFQGIRSWCDPTVFSRVLKCFRCVKTLTICQTWVPADEIRNIVSTGEFGKELTSLFLLSPYPTVPTLVSLILSLPHLRELSIDSVARTEPPASILPDTTWQREPLQSLALSWYWSGEVEFIALCGITSRRIDLADCDAMIEKIIARSSETMSELVLQDVYPCLTSIAFPPLVHLPPLPALTTVEVKIYWGSLSARLADILSCIRSAPALSSIIFKYPRSSAPENIATSRVWVDVDRWLARLAIRAKTGRSLTVILTPWPEGDSEWELEGYLPEFRKAGGELRVLDKI